MIYSYDVSREEKQILLECYERILENLAWYIKSLQNETVFEDFFVCVFLLFDGFLSSSHTFTPSNEFEYVFFQNIPYSLYPFNGMGCCRHANEVSQLLITDISNLTFLYESIFGDMKRISEIIKKYENYARLHITYVYP